jgi:hypothetical protein
MRRAHIVKLPLAIALLSLNLVACGGAVKSSSSSSTKAAAGSDTPTASSARQPGPDSNDSDDDPGSDDDKVFVDYGNRASPADRRAITALVKRYYVAAASADGGKACPMVYGLIAERLTEEYAQAHGMSSGSCATALSALFKQRHGQLASDPSLLKVTRIRIGGDKGYVFVFLGSVPEPYLTVHREEGAWKIESLFETGLP